MAAPTTVELLWGTRHRPTRGPKPALSLEVIVAEAIALADSEGLANLSMQRLAERLGFTKMSLYRYVPGKEQLTALMLDTALGEPPAATEPAPADGTWRVGLRHWARTIFERYRAHPWTIELTTGARAIGPNELAWMEAALTALRDTGLTGPERLDTIVLLNGHVRSLVQQTRPETETRDSGDRAEQIMAQFFAAVGASGGRYPEVLAAFAEEAAAAADPSASGDALAFGIERILDGLGVLIAARA
ncbi:TetR/AcrR family transcriptional regulator C-terminal domain-containing protein [Nocardia higoensis]|uniref:TetR/AcrR family transcriptional regulator C-terminal domain-containing protein n=1 Tax=Nocardia higoensis TaxID=228599 RepID=A0ABS0D4F6_9NOCA|nr:TetR/AcrR family transcriptional regulator [Nocardia higoensis]MBF6353216.1 TetR/AcrR family transcriptional regulator C-terminal domain-containing protein [Nocardia higoensis]